jgi:type IV pilus assembly protein PilB
MATPNDPPKKPTPPVPPGKAPPPKPAPVPGVKPAGGVQPPAKPGVQPPAKPGAQPPARPGVQPPAKPGAKPIPAAGARPANGPPAPGAKPKPGAVPAKKPAAKKADRSEGSSRGGKRRLGQVLIDLGYIDDDQLWGILDEAKSNGLPCGQVAVSRGLINEDQLLQALAEQNGLKIANLQEVQPQAEVIALVPETMADVYKILPLTLTNKVLTIVIGDPSNLAAVDDLRNLLSLNEVVALLASPTAIAEAKAKFYAGKEESIMDVIAELETNTELGKNRGGETSIDLASLAEIADAAPVRKLINMVFLLAIKDKASDIHFEPFEEEYKMRYRCDGVLYEMVPPPRHLATAIASRIKVMANLDISERRMPQDGRIELNLGGNRVDMRVSILPTMFGESACLRLLDRTNTSLDLNKCGMLPEMLATFREMIAKPNGIILVTGPTGSGKTTTLYSALNELNIISEKIITTEDPVEYDIDGLIQVPINAEIGVTFASALRAILRQDPDKILVGEIRDLETAQIAVQAALTGHIVFSTLHTNDAPSSITRLRDMGLEPFLITAALEAILAQRLVRKICVDCRTEFEPSAEMLMELNLRPEDVKGKPFFYGRGCDRCNNTGHKGRMGIHELLIMNDDLRDLVSSGASTDILRKACQNQGMRSLREAGLRAIHDGLTTLEEVVRETVLEEGD